MEVVFLSASKPIIKSYKLDASGTLVKSNYPFVYDVTSYVEQPKDLKDLKDLLDKYAAKGFCMLKGLVHRPLVKESRAGSTNADDKTDWICLDLDGIENYQSIDLFLKDIGCDNVDHIVQWSSSMGIENSTGFRCHIFMRLSGAIHPQLLKFWLMNLNLTTPALKSQLTLTKTGNALRWPLDITTCQNDKLLYIAPPHLDPNIVDPFPSNNRITFQKRKHATLKLPHPIPTRDALRQLTDERIAELRTAAGLSKRRTTKFKFAGTTEYMVSPDAATITEMKLERGFVYFNLNGGNSWAYYHPEDNPMFIYNFKGEPTYRTEDLLPEYWARLQQQASSYTPNAKGLIYFAFRDFRSSNYYNGTYDAKTDNLNFAMAKNESQLRHFMKQHGQPMGDFVPDWDIVWEPLNPIVVDPANKKLNKFQPSEFMKLDLTTLPRVSQVPPTILKVISHVSGNHQPTIDYVLNWLAVILQYRTKTGTALVLQGTQGTGKGVFFHHIMAPILNEINVTSKRMEELESEFTGFMENIFLAFIDEIESGRSMYHSKITAKLKNLIVEPFISIRKMYSPPYMAPNHCNMIFASNKPAPVEIAPDDRRFTVAPYQEQPIQLTASEIDVQIPAELKDFYAYLMQFPADADKARKPLDSDARNTLIKINRSSIDEVADALLDGDLQALWESMPTNKPDGNSLFTTKLAAYRQIMLDVVQNGETKLTRDDLFAIFDWCVGTVPSTPNKFTALLKHHRIHLKQIWKDNRNVKGITVDWASDPVWLAGIQQEIATGLI